MESPVLMLLRVNGILVNVSASSSIMDFFEFQGALYYPELHAKTLGSCLETIRI